MAIIFDGPVTPDELTAFVREVPTPAEYTLDSLFPNRTIDRNEVGIEEITRRNRTARFRAFDARLHVSERDYSELRRVGLPPLSSSLNRGELERLQLEFARTGGTRTAAIVNAIYDDAEILTREVDARMELARGDVLTDGRFTLVNEGGLSLEADYGVPAEHLVAPAVAWTDTANAPIISDLLAWSAVYRPNAGAGPGRFLTSYAVVQLMLQNAEVIAEAIGEATTRTRVSPDELAGLLSRYGLPGIEVYDTQVDVDGVDTRIVPADRFVFAPAGPLGYTAWGVSATALELVDSSQVDMSFADAPGVVGVVEKVGPPYREFTLVDAVGMPVLEQPKRLLVADVGTVA